MLTGTHSRTFNIMGEDVFLSNMDRPGPIADEAKKSQKKNKPNTEPKPQAQTTQSIQTNQTTQPTQTQTRKQEIPKHENQKKETQKKDTQSQDIPQQLDLTKMQTLSEEDVSNFDGSKDFLEKVIKSKEIDEHVKKGKQIDERFIQIRSRRADFGDPTIRNRSLSPKKGTPQPQKQKKIEFYSSNRKKQNEVSVHQLVADWN